MEILYDRELLLILEYKKNNESKLPVRHRHEYYETKLDVV